MLEVFRWLFEAGMTPNDPNWLRVTPLHVLAIGRTAHGSDGQTKAAAARRGAGAGSPSVGW